MDGLRVGVTSGRQGHVLASAFRRRGASVLWGPTLAGDRAPADDLDVTAALADSDWVVASTGMAVRMTSAAAEASGHTDGLRAALASSRVVARGVKAHGALRALGVEPVFVSPQETDRDTAAWLAAHVLPGQQVVVLSHGTDDAGAYRAVAEAGAALSEVRPYRSAPPEDVEPARRLVDAACGGDLDVVVCTSPNAFRSLLDIAADVGRRAELLDVLTCRLAVAVVGPVTARAVEEAGVPIGVMPLRARNAELVRAVEAWAGRGRRLPVGPLTLLPAQHAVRTPESVVRLGELEFGLLASVVRRPEVVCPPRVLAVEVWGHTAPQDVLAVKHLVSRVRRKLGSRAATLETVRSVGYRYAPFGA